MINYSKKVEDSLVLPAIRQPKSATERPKSFSKTMVSKMQNTKNTNRDKSISIYSNFIPQISQNIEEKINSLKKSAADSFLQQNLNILPEGRQLGNKKYAKPKFWKKRPDVLPRELRLDPFAERNIIRAQDLNKGILSLIQKGQIGKDVDIITAFEKGGSVLNSQGAVIHQGEQRIASFQLPRRHKKKDNKEVDYSKILTKMSNIGYEQNSWAITMPASEFTPIEGIRKSFQLTTNRDDKCQDIQQPCHLKFVHYVPVENLELKKFKINNLSMISEINSLLLQISKILLKNCLEVVYVNALKLIDFATRVKKVSETQLIACILTFKNKDRIPLNQIVNLKEKKKVAVSRIISLFRMKKVRRNFQRYLNIKRVQNKIYDWIYNFHVAKKFKELLQTHKKKVVQDFRKLQQDFKKSYCSIQGGKHYEIHISNKSIMGRLDYKQLLNTEITRIFNFQNPNTYIIMILSEPVAEETKNYYYKIMELEEIPNFRDRVTFLNARSNSPFASNKFSSSEKLYYDSKLVRQLKSLIGKSSAYFRISYPNLTDLSMATYFKIPILTGDLLKLMQIQQRSESLNFFGIPQLPCLRLKPNQFKPFTLSSALTQFCEKNKRYRNFVVKLNGSYQSKGIALLTYPFASLPEIYSNTSLIYRSELSISQFYRKLCKKGGIIQVFQQNLSSIILMGKIGSKGEIQLTGTYDKISSGFVNIGYFFPQLKVSHNQTLDIFNSVSQKLLEAGHFGDFQVSIYVDENLRIYLDKVQCYQTQIGSSLFYFNFLCHGNLNSKGQFITQITETYETQDNKEEQLISLQPRSYCYLPYILHFGLSDKQVGSFFQLCRIGGISFDLENKYGSTFILLGSLKNSMGMITTAKDRQSCKKLMIKSLEFIIKQNAYNNSRTFVQEKEIRMRERENILALKERLENQ